MKNIDAVLISTSPASWIDVKRTQDALDYIEKKYGNLKNYSGVYIVAGELEKEVREGTKKFEDSQRENILKTLKKEGITDKQIIVIDGQDSVDKVNRLSKLLYYEIKSHDSHINPINRLGISTYLLHYLRYKLVINAAKKEKKINRNFKTTLIWSPTSLNRAIKDSIYGIAALLKDFYRLRRGFTNAVNYHPFEKSIKKAKDWNSEKR